MKVPKLEMWREPVDALFYVVMAEHCWEGGDRPCVFMLVERSAFLHIYGDLPNQRYEHRRPPSGVHDALERRLHDLEYRLTVEYGARGWLDRWRQDKASASQHRQRRAANPGGRPVVGRAPVA